MTNKINNMIANKKRTDLLKLIHICCQCGKNPTSRHEEDSGYYINCDSCRKIFSDRLKIYRARPKLSRDDDLYKLIDKETDGVLTKCRKLNYEYTARWKKEHPKENKEINLKWYHKNKEKVLAYQKIWREKNKDKIKSYYQKKSFEESGCIIVDIPLE